MGKTIRCPECRELYNSFENLEDLRDNDGICLVCNAPIEDVDWDRILASYEEDDFDDVDDVEELDDLDAAPDDDDTVDERRGGYGAWDDDDEDDDFDDDDDDDLDGFTEIDTDD